uniref:Uncharacterized protein n=1 Tax=Chromera velia CCMP2878 TaxID=1169474 RepID=A0A0G4FMF4_9ALVE|eukprot:Cvel_17696.t1-p1 / transcript=Cvel_17696.t1 / gene=Cvel_17696 / organism=Chromera_velia_CCMP2878 / gene_product=U4/U6 small nuclear ribonucleoprotein Prp3, putative / transcript_product=U4/U6 small nuclear ribonucleoprotein Prp3, putative / location=Cvel_scaffold1428:26383-36312(-) / protein_length=788 / sequence_SO=supercontig / SO=protein_coding / is_pseudo=false
MAEEVDAKNKRTFAEALGGAGGTEGQPRTRKTRWGQAPSESAQTNGTASSSSAAAAAAPAANGSAAPSAAALMAQQIQQNPGVSVDLTAVIKAREALEAAKRQMEYQKKVQEHLVRLKAGGGGGAPPPPAAAAAAAGAGMGAVGGLGTLGALGGGAAGVGALSSLGGSVPAPPPGMGMGMGGGGATGVVGGGLGGTGPKAPGKLRLDQQGRTVDEFGNVVEMKPQVTSTLKVNINKERTQRTQQVMIQAARQAQDTSKITKSKWFDDSLAAPKPTAAAMGRTQKKGLSFVDQGKYVRQEVSMQRKAAAKALGLEFKKAGIMKKYLKEEEDDPNKIEVKWEPPVKEDEGAQEARREEERREAIEAVPDVEWWDLFILTKEGEKDTRQAGAEGEEMKILKGEGQQTQQTPAAGAGEETEAAAGASSSSSSAAAASTDLPSTKEPKAKEEEGGEAAEKEKEKEASADGPGTASSSPPAGDGASPPPPTSSFSSLPAILQGISLTGVTTGQSYTINPFRITHLVEHPVPIQPPAEAGAPAVVSMYLTLREKKKLRRRKRQEKEKEKQNKIRLGQLPPPPPKVKLSNLMRVLKNESVAEPSKAERVARQQMAERLKRHEDANEARRLDPEAKKEKKEAKWKAGTDLQHEVCVWAVKYLANKRHLFKVDMNAQQYHLKGAALVCAQLPFHLVVVEGGTRAVTRYSKLMMRRINWGEEVEAARAREDDADESDEEREESRNCHLVWRGVLKDPVFKKWSVIVAKDVEEARSQMKSQDAEHYLEMMLKWRDPQRDI